MSVCMFVRERNSWKVSVCVCRCQSTHCLRVCIVWNCMLDDSSFALHFAMLTKYCVHSKRRWMFFETSTWEKLQKINKSRTLTSISMFIVWLMKEWKSEKKIGLYHTLILDLHKNKKRSIHITNWCYILENYYNNANWHAPFASASLHESFNENSIRWSKKKTESKPKSMQKRVSIQIFTN